MTTWGRRLALAGITAGLGTAGALVVLAILVDLDTADKTASIFGAIAALITGAVSLMLLLRNGPTSALEPSANASGERAVAAGGSIVGIVSTGDHSPRTVTTPRPATGQPPYSPAPRGGATASGDRAVAAGGDITGQVATGDGGAEGNS